MTASTENKRKKQKTGGKIRWWAPWSHLAAPPPTMLCTQLCFICRCRVGDAAGKNRPSGSWAPCDKTKPRPCFAEPSCCVWGVLQGREHPKPMWSCDVCLLIAEDTWGSMVSRERHVKSKRHLALQRPDSRDHTHCPKPGLSWHCRKLQPEPFLSSSTCSSTAMGAARRAPHISPLDSCCRDLCWWHFFCIFSVPCSTLWIAQPHQGSWHCLHKEEGASVRFLCQVFLFGETWLESLLLQDQKWEVSKPKTKNCSA